MAVVKGTLRPLRDGVLLCDMEFGEEVTKSGIVLKSDDGKSEGIKPRWGRVWAIGPEQQDVKVGDWVLMEHGRWSRTHKYETDDGSILKIQKADTNAMMMVSDEKPSDIQHGIGV
jgi:co-chaperonin GroES (HSP10)